MAYKSQQISGEIDNTITGKELPFRISVYSSFHDIGLEKEPNIDDGGPEQHVMDLQWENDGEDRRFTTEWRLKKEHTPKAEQWRKISEKMSSFGFKLFQKNVILKLYNEFKACLTVVKGWDLRFIITHATKSQLKMTLMKTGDIAAVFNDFFGDVLGNVEFEVSPSDEHDSFTPVPVGFVERCKNILERLKQKCGPDGRNELFEKTEERLSKIVARMVSPPTVTVAVHGVTGVGKSSLLNALLDTSSLMPTGSLGKSVTSVAIMVEANENNDNYEADIEFISEKEWSAELQCLQRDIDDDVDDQEKASDVKQTALDRLTAVYGRRVWESQEAYESELLKKLETTETIKKTEAQALGKALSSYAKNTEDEFQYWPLVKKIVIRVPVRSLCESGCRLVDLPGTGDTNSAREKVGQEYIEHCDLMLIVAHISRVISDKTVANALGENLLRDLRMDQRKAVVVCSHSDQLDSQSEIIKKFDLKEARQLGEEIRTHESKRQKLRKQKNLSAAELEELVQLDARIDEKKKRKLSLCVRAKNDYIRKNLQEKLKSELHDPDGKMVDVFCVSSTEYLKYLKCKMQGSNMANDLGDEIDDEDDDEADDDNDGMKFSSERDTEIPQLRDYLRSTADKKRREVAEKCQDEFLSLVSDLKTYATNSFHLEELKILAKKGPKTLLGNSKTDVLTPVNIFMEEQLWELYSAIDEARSDAVPFTRILRQKWEKEFPYKTYQAIVAEHRKGVYSSRKFGKIDWNEQLSEPFFDRIEKPWTEGFACDVWEASLDEKVMQPAKSAIDDWGEKMKAILRRTSQDEDNLNINELCTNLKSKLDIQDIVTFVRNTERTLYHTRSNTMQFLMSPTYVKVSGKSTGKGALKEMHREMETELTERCTEIFDQTAAFLVSQLDQLKETVEKMVEEKLKEMQMDVDALMEPIRQKDVIREIQNNITEINELLADCRRLVAKQRSQTSRKRTAGPGGDSVDPIPSTSSETHVPKKMKQS